MNVEQARALLNEMEADREVLNLAIDAVRRVLNYNGTIPVSVEPEARRRPARATAKQHGGYRRNARHWRAELLRYIAKHPGQTSLEIYDGLHAAPGAERAGFGIALTGAVRDGKLKRRRGRFYPVKPVEERA